MSLFLTHSEREQIQSQACDSSTSSLLAAMQLRVQQRIGTPGFSDPTATTLWWHHAAEYLTDAALVQALRPAPQIAAWLRAAVLSIVRLPISDWGGPPFRGYAGGELVGTLETGHLTWSISVAIDLVPEIFTKSEYDEITGVLRNHGLQPCRRFLANTNFCHNWNCVLLAGFAVAAAVLNDSDALDEAINWFPLAADHFQSDGSYGESLQYANYAAYSIILAREAIMRRSPVTQLTLEPYAHMVHWATHSLFYRKPLSGWGSIERARSANFGDSAALFRPSGDLLMHIAVHAKNTLPTEAGLARWLFDSLYFPANEPPPHDLASFGFLPGFGFLSVILMPSATAALSPTAAKLPTLAAFSCGDVLARDAWNGLTTLAARTASQPRNATAHIHGDINSFILVHRKERLLLDPGHSCYRNINHDLEAASLTHNTCTFEIPGTNNSSSRMLTQRGGINRPIVRDGKILRGDAPIDLGGRRIIASQLGPVCVIGSEAAPLYGAPLRCFTRLWLLCGAHTLFIIDHIESDEALRTTWHWLLNNRDGLLDLQLMRPDRLLAQRGDAAMKLMHCGDGQMSGPIYAHVHDAYHPLPAQLGEGRPGSGLLMRWTEIKPQTNRTMIHAICMDDIASISAWNAHRENHDITLQGPNHREQWTLRNFIDFRHFRLEEIFSKQAFDVDCNDAGEWSLSSSAS